MQVSISMIRQGFRITEIRSRSRKLAQETGNLGLILIDYLQLITGTGRKIVNKRFQKFPVS